MSWHFLQEQEGASWEASSLDGAPSALLSLMPIAAGCCLPDSGTDSCRDSRSGTMSPRSMETRGGAASMSLAEDSPAPIIAPASTSTTEATTTMASQCVYGDTWLGLLVKFDRDTSSWKTARDLFAEDLPESSVILPQWGLMVGGELYQLKTQALPISASDSGGYSGRMYPTPRSRDHHGECRKRWGNRHSLPGALADVLGGAPPPPEFSEWLMGWPIKWTDCAPLETASVAQWLRSHGVSSADPSSTQPHT
jgi:hypothetical protein